MAESWATLKMSYKVNLHPKLSHNRSGLLFWELKQKGLDKHQRKERKKKSEVLSVNNS